MAFTQTLAVSLVPVASCELLQLPRRKCEALCFAVATRLAKLRKQVARHALARGFSSLHVCDCRSKGNDGLTLVAGTKTLRRIFE